MVVEEEELKREASAASLEASAASLEASATAGDLEDSDTGDVVKWVEMPMADIRWILAQKKENHVVPPLEDYSEDAMKSTIFTQKYIDEKREVFTNLHASIAASLT